MVTAQQAADLLVLHGVTIISGYVVISLCYWLAGKVKSLIELKNASRTACKPRTDAFKSNRYKH